MYSLIQPQGWYTTWMSRCILHPSFYQGPYSIISLYEKHSNPAVSVWLKGNSEKFVTCGTEALWNCGIIVAMWNCGSL